jgi:hypothetical protein
MAHGNLSNYLMCSTHASEEALAHRLAATLIAFQTDSGDLPMHMCNLCKYALPATPPPFTTIAEVVDQTEGVRLADLFANLPCRAPNSDDALAAIWQLVQDIRENPPTLITPNGSIPPEVWLPAEHEAGQAFLSTPSTLPVDEASRINDALPDTLPDTPYSDPTDPQSQ